jgi:TPR repeat protein
MVGRDTVKLSADPPCLAYEYIEGGDLAGLIQSQRGGLPPRQAARLVQSLAEIVGFAHRLNPPVVHRDLKPANILMEHKNGKLALRITDFGIGGLAVQQAVSQSRRGTTSGEFLTAAWRGAYTPLYASPQQMRGEDRPDPRDDVYALGVIWYQMLTGDLTKGRPGGEAWRKRLADRGMTPALLALLASSYEDERADRPSSGAEFADKIGLTLREPSPASPPPFPEAIPVLEALPSEKPQPGLPPRAREALDADWRTYEQLLFEGQGKEDEFLRQHAPARLSAWRFAAESGNPQGQVLVGECFLQGLETEKAPDEALKWFRKAAEQGFAVGQASLGGAYLLGEGVSKDTDEGLKWLRKAAEKGFASGQYALAAMYLAGDGISKDTDEGLKWLRKAAEKGHAPSHVLLAHMYENGDGVPMDEDESAKWYGKALKWLRARAEGGHLDSQCTLGVIYSQGRGVAKNDAEAVKWFRKAAEQDSAAAQSLLGIMYSEGRGVSQDDTEAVRWFRKSAEQGNATGESFLGMMYFQGKGGVPQDISEAVRWLHKSAEQGYVASQYLLGVLHERGSGVAKNATEAREWYGKAAAQGHEESKKALERMGRSLWRRMLGI